MSRSIAIFRKNSLFPESRSTSRSSILGDSNNRSNEGSSATTLIELQENALRYSVVARQTLPPLEKISAESSQVETVLHKSPSQESVESLSTPDLGIAEKHPDSEEIRIFLEHLQTIYGLNLPKSMKPSA